MSEAVTITPRRYLARSQGKGTGGDDISEPTLEEAGFNIEADVTVDESHNDSLTITRHPVQQGASITDHAFNDPSQVTIRVGWTNSGARAAGDENYVAAIYERLLKVKQSRIPFDVQTGKRLYKNMLFQGLQTTTDQYSEATLLLVATLQEIIIVQTQTTTVAPAAVHEDAAKTAPVVSQGTVQPRPVSNRPDLGGID